MAASLRKDISYGCSLRGEITTNTVLLLKFLVFAKYSVYLR